MEELGFKKIELEDDNLSQKGEDSSDSSSSAPSGKAKIKLPSLKFGFLKTKKGKGITAVLIVILILAMYLGVQGFALYRQGQVVYAQAQKAADAAKAQNAVLTKEELVKTKEELEHLQQNMGTVAFAKFIPLFGGYISDGIHLLNAAEDGIDAAIITTDSVIPYADVLGLKGEGSFVGGSAEERIRTAVTTLDKVVPRIDDIDKKLQHAKSEVDQVRLSRYPNFWIFKKLRDRIENIKSLVDDGATAVTEGKPLIKVLPNLMGADSAKKYLIIFQNDKELRPTGGFLTYYSIFRIDQGVIHIDTSNDIYTLDNSISSHPEADPIILKYLPKVYTQNIRDINLSPDFQKSMESFREYYDRSYLKTDIDGIIAIDTQFLVDIIEILGEVQAAGQTFHAKIDPVCDCPQVVYQLELNTTKPVNFVRSDRKAIVGDLLYATMQKALSISPKIYWGPLFQAAIENANQKHILFSLNNKGAQQGIEALNWAGKIKNFEGDYLHINDANFGGAKSNMYIVQSVKMDYDVKSSGEIEKTVEITYQNTHKHSDCNLETGGLCLNAVLRNFQRIYVPEGSTLTASKGSEVKVETKKDLGKTYFEGFFTVNPLGRSTITYTYKLPFKVEADSALPLLIQKQPGVEKIAFEINVNDKKNQGFDLVGDRQIQINL